LSEGDIYSKAKNQMRLSERILAAVPGFRGYKEKELRRESDRLVRNHLYRRLSAVKSDLKDAFQTLSDRRMIEAMKDMDRLIARFDRVAAKIDHASYGYTGFFDVVKVEEASLDRMIEFDKSLVDGVEKMAEEVRSFKIRVVKREVKDLGERIQRVAEALEVFEETYDGRGEVILGVS